MQFKIKVISDVDKTNKYNGFITKESYNSNHDLKNDLIAFLINLYPWLRWSTTIDHFIVDFEKMREIGISEKELNESIEEVDKYIDAYNSITTGFLEELMLKEVEEEYDNIVGNFENSTK